MRLIVAVLLQAFLVSAADAGTVTSACVSLSAPNSSQVALAASRIAAVSSDGILAEESQTRAEQIASGLHFKKVSPLAFAARRNETPGEVEVPLDRGDPEGAKISIFYRLIGDRSKPLLVFLNGGPGMASSHFVSLDGRNNSLWRFLHDFRLLLIDQRGTGRSAPLDQKAPGLQASLVMSLFGAGQHALDTQAVLRQAVAAGTDFWLLAHSYGGQIGFHYLSDPAIDLKPRGIIFASPVAPYQDALQAFVKRREAQIVLNEKVLGPRPDLREKILRLKQRIREAAYVDAQGTPLKPGFVSALWTHLSEPDDMAHRFERTLNKLIDPKTPIETVDAIIKGWIYPQVNLLNYAISAAECSPGWSDAQIMKASDEALLRKGRPFKDWMLDETEIGLTEENQRDFCGGKYASFLQAVDQLAPSSAVVVPVEKMREALAATPALFIAAPDDMFISFDDEREQFEKLKSPESRFATIPGGHAALYSKPGVNAIRAFVKSAH